MTNFVDSHSLVIDLFVAGVPEPKGSTTTYSAHGRSWTTSANKGLKAWEQAVRNTVALRTAQAIHGPVTMELGFVLPQPKSRLPRPKSKDPLKRHPVPDVEPDLDKLQRGVLDAIQYVLIDNDSKVLGVNAYKYYGSPPGVRIVVRPYPALEVLRGRTP